MKGEGTVKLDILDDFRQELVEKNLTLRADICLDLLGNVWT